MKKRAGGGVSSELQRVVDLIGSWRRTRARLGPMPEELWTEAARVARVVGVSRAAAVMRLGFGALKRRTADESPAARAVVVHDGFVDVPGIQLAGSAARSGAVVELLAPGGMRLTVRLPACEAVDMAALVGAFCGRAA